MNHPVTPLLSFLPMKDGYFSGIAKSKQGLLT
jgi:hypothetical protein